MKKTFFESLIISDSERIHSQTIAWILSLGNDVFPTLEKIKFLESLLKCELGASNKVYVETEISNLDIFINLENDQIIIENKLKSSEHSGQTIKYSDSIPDIFKDENKTVYFGFLTLIKDNPENSDWTSISYEDLLSALQEAKFNKGKREFIFIEEYIVTVNNLVSVFNKFVKNHTAFKSVFTDGYKKKVEKKKYENVDQDYIRVNQLETIFQKAFLTQIARRLNTKNYYIAETRGTALLQIVLDSFEYNNELYVLGIQIQNNTLKVNIRHIDYSISQPSLIDANFMNSFETTFKSTLEKTRLNKPKTKAYLSVSKKLKRQLYEFSIDEIVSLLKKEINYVNEKKTEFLYLIKRSN